MSNRNPYDGEPYYCGLCGAGFGEYIACESDDGCVLETRESAQRRRADKLALGAVLSEALNAQAPVSDKEGGAE